MVHGRQIGFLEMTPCAAADQHSKRFKVKQFSYLPDQRLQLCDSIGQTDAEGDSVWEAGDSAGDNGPPHGEGQHCVDDKHNK